MKRLLFAIGLLWPLFIYAEDAVCIYTIDGQKEFFLIKNKPKLTINEQGVEMSTEEETIIFPLDIFSKLTIESILLTSIEPKPSPVYTIKDNSISTGGNIKAYDTQGREVEQSSNGMIDLSNAPKGIYIVKTNSVSFKYLKK